jgi:hypothetical protein
MIKSGSQSLFPSGLRGYGSSNELKSLNSKLEFETKKDSLPEEPLDVLKYNKIPDFTKFPSMATLYNAYKRMRNIVHRTPL